MGIRHESAGARAATSFRFLDAERVSKRPGCRTASGNPEGRLRVVHGLPAHGEPVIEGAVIDFELAIINVGDKRQVSESSCRPGGCESNVSLRRVQTFASEIRTSAPNL